MLVHITAALLLTSQTPDSTATSQRFPPPHDTATAALVAAARRARDRNERLISEYHVRATQRMGMGLQARSRDRMLFHQEMAVDIAWRRDSITTVTVVGARQGVPIAMKGDQFPTDLPDQVNDLVIDPGSDYLRFLDANGRGGTFLNPLSTGSDSAYQFAKGNTTSIGISSGREIRLVALDVRARRPDFRLVDGTFWFDEATHNLVRAVFRPSRPFDLRRDATEMKGTALTVSIQAETRYITVEYALYEGRWWMPRYVGIDAVGQVGSWLDVPFRFERTYSDYEIVGGTPPDSTSTFRPAGRRSGERNDSTPRNRCRADSLTTGCNLTVIIPPDTVSLLTASVLGPPILTLSDLTDDAEIGALTQALSRLPDRAWEFSPRLPHGISALLEHARFNRVEGVSLGLGGELDVGKLQASGVVRMGLADGIPRGEMTLRREQLGTQLSLSAYSRLAPTNPENTPLNAIGSFMGFVAGRDDGEYFQRRGVELTATQAASGWWSTALWADVQRAVQVESRGSLPHLLGRNAGFRDNFQADHATQFGASLSLHGTRVQSRHLTLGLRTELMGETGDFSYGRGSLTALALVTPDAPLSGALTLAAGTTAGSAPVQGGFFLGGSGSLRGYAGGVMHGDSYWRVRAELGSSARAVRVITFTDLGWAGPRQQFGRGTPLIGTGMGVSFLDGLFRVDLARALRAPTGWRLEFYVDGLL